jgi:hypothetical protein
LQINHVRFYLFSSTHPRIPLNVCLATKADINRGIEAK